MSLSTLFGVALGWAIGSFLFGFIEAWLKDPQFHAWLKAKRIEFEQRAAWSAWNYARKRAVAREKWVPGEAQAAREEDTPDRRRIAANEARQVLDNRHFIDAWNAMNYALEMSALKCDTTTREGIEKAAQVTTAKQLLHGLKREFERKLTDGYMAEVELMEIEKRKRPVRFER